MKKKSAHVTTLPFSGRRTQIFVCVLVLFISVYLLADIVGGLFDGSAFVIATNYRGLTIDTFLALIEGVAVTIGLSIALFKLFNPSDSTHAKRRKDRV